jgi:hypothetical protein
MTTACNTRSSDAARAVVRRNTEEVQGNIQGPNLPRYSVDTMNALTLSALTKFP